MPLSPVGLRSKRDSKLAKASNDALANHFASRPINSLNVNA